MRMKNIKMHYFTIFRAWCKEERFTRPQSKGLYQLFFSWDKSILSWPTKLKLLWECNRISIQFVVPLLQKLSALPENIAAKKKIINFFLSQMSTSRLILYFLYLDKNPVRFVSALKKLICNVYWSIVLLIEGVKYGKK